ncbi:tetratricopeptide repeat protein [bacterium]|nr:tetratricopeptide repeat protein [bacterium]
MRLFPAKIGWLIILLMIGFQVSYAQKLTHSAVINGVKQRLINSEAKPSEKDAQLQQAIDLLLNNNVIRDTKEKDKEETYFYLGNVYYRQNEFSKAFEAFQNALSFGKKYWDKEEKLSGGTPLFSIKAALNDMKLKTFNKANRAFNEAQKMAAVNPDSMKLLINDAISKFETILSWDPKVFINEQSYAAGVYGTIVNCYFQLLNNEKDEAQKDELRNKALANLEKLTEIDKNNLSIYYNIYMLYDQAKNQEKSLEWIDKALQVQVTDSASIVLKTQLIAQKAFILDVMNKPDEALKVYQEAIKSDPNNADLHFNLARLYILRKEMDKALDEFKTIKRLKPDDVESNYQVADETYTVYSRERSSTIEKMGGDKADMKKVTDALKPQIENVIKNLEEALRVLELNLPTAVDQLEYNYRIGKCYTYIAQLQGDLGYNLENKEKVKLQKPFFEKSLPFLKKTVELKNDHKNAWNLLLVAYTNLQMKAEAQKAMENFSKLK